MQQKEPEAVSNSPWFLPVGCYSIIVMREAVEREYPAGPLAFEYTFRPTRKTSLHYLVIALSQREAQRKVDQLAEAGLKAGQDLAGADRLGVPVFDCPGVVFRNLSRTGGNYWRVEDPWMVPQQAEPSQPEGPLMIDRAGRLVASLQEPGAGLVIGSRERLNVRQNADEFLCVFSGHWGYLLDVCRYTWLGEVPGDWYDSSGLLLAEYLDERGKLRCPKTIDGRRVLGHLDGGFVGEFQSVSGGPEVQISDGSATMVEAALQALGWSIEWVPDVQRALEQLVEARQEPQVPSGQPVAISSGAGA